VMTFTSPVFPDLLIRTALLMARLYYWRIDEVNDADPNSPWKGDVWSFTVTPKIAYIPGPADGAEFIDLNVQLTWTAGFGAKLHYIVFGEDYDEVNNAAAVSPTAVRLTIPACLIWPRLTTGGSMSLMPSLHIKEMSGALQLWVRSVARIRPMMPWT